MTNLKTSRAIIRKSPYSVSETIERLKKAISAKGMIMFAMIDHSGEAQKSHINLNEEKLLIFGDPKVGTFLLQENPLIGIELPLRLLVWQDEKKLTQIAYIDPLFLEENYKISKNGAVLRKMSSVLAVIVAEAAQEAKEGEVKI